MNDVVLSFTTTKDLLDKPKWITYFKKLEDLLKGKLTHLDTNDPVRKKVDDLVSSVDYLCRFSDKENYRSVFGKFNKSKITIDFWIYKNVKFEEQVNSINIYFPEKFYATDFGFNVISEIFRVSNSFLKPFYSYGDLTHEISKKRKLSGFSVDIEEELPGVYWLTYFNHKYMDFFGNEKFNKIQCNNVDDNGVTLMLGESPTLINTDRLEIEDLLGKNSFVDPELETEKLIGKYALTINQLKQ